MSKSIYKYCSLSSAIKIIKSESVLLNNPKCFNDPFDSQIDIFEKDKINAEKLMINYYFFKEICKFISEIETKKLRKFQKIKLKLIIALIHILKRLITKNKIYQYNPLLNLIISSVRIKRPEIDNIILRAKKEFNNNIVKTNVETSEKARITCFSKRNDSILMWSHYADSHRGVCIEFESDDSIMRDVRYTDKRVHININKALEIIFGYDFVNKKISYRDKKLMSCLLMPFFTKSLDWSYENEVRCLLSKDDYNIKGVKFDNGQMFLQLKIKKIYVGIKASGELLNEVLRLAKNRQIPIIFMKESNFNYAIIPDDSRKVNIDYTIKKVPDKLWLLIEEIEKCLDNELYISALCDALIIPGVLGKLLYKNLDYKSAYIKWYQEYYGKYNKSIGNTNMPYINGEVLYRLKLSLHDYAHSNIKGDYKEFKIDDYKLVVTYKNIFDIYVGGSSLSSDSYNNKRGELDINIRKICKELIDGFYRFNKVNPLLLNECSSYNLEFLDKEIDELKEEELMFNSTD